VILPRATTDVCRVPYHKVARWRHHARNARRNVAPPLGMTLPSCTFQHLCSMSINSAPLQYAHTISSSALQYVDMLSPFLLKRPRRPSVCAMTPHLLYTMSICLVLFFSDFLDVTPTNTFKFVSLHSVQNTSLYGHDGGMLPQLYDA
jgi:hypothetical protein